MRHLDHLIGPQRGDRPAPVSDSAVNFGRTQFTNRTAGYTNTGAKQPHGYRVDRTGADFSAGFASYQSLIQLGVSLTPDANTAWQHVGPLDVATMSGWILDLGATATTKQTICGNFGIAFENINATPGAVRWCLELDMSNYTGASVAADERYGAFLICNANGSAGGAIAEGVRLSRVGGAPAGTGITRGIYMSGVRSKGITFEAMTEVGSLTIFESYLFGDSASRFGSNQDGALNWGSGSAAGDTALQRNTSGGGLILTLTNAVTNAVSFAERLRHSTSGTAAVGFGVGREIELENANGTFLVVATEEFSFSDATNATEDVSYKLRLIKAGTLTDAWTINSVGNGTLAGDLTVAGNVFLTTASAGLFFKSDFSEGLYRDASDNIFLDTGGIGTHRLTVTSNGNVVVSNAALATNATDGFLYVPTCAGTPTGTPTTFAGRAPIIVNTTNNKLYFYSSGAWRDAGP